MKLNLQANACDPEQLESFLSGALSDADEREFSSHLNTCENCRRSLQEQAAEPETWMEAEKLLKPAEFDSPSSDEAADSETLKQSPRQPLQIQHVLAALGPTDDPAMLGRLGGYEVSGVVGAGGMGVVLKAIDKSLDRTVAIKVLAPHLATSGAARKRFAREAKAAAAVLHPNVIAIHSVGSDESLPYLVMPYVRGTSLQKRLDREGPLSLQEILRIGSQIAAGLAAAHAQGLVHRDIKPANILLEDGVERVTITDFGLARAVDDASITHSGVIAGTPQYMSPEQARGEAVDGRSDIFSLGSVLYAICTGRPPFRAETTYGVMRRITDDEPTAIREINPEIPDWLCRVITRLMSKSAANRFASAAEISELFEKCLAHLQQPGTVPLPASLATKVNRFRLPKLSRLSLGAIAMITALGLGIFGMFLWQASEAPDIAGKWSGPDWGEVVLEQKEPGEYAGTYTDTFKEKPGKIELKWSRLEGRYKGTWQEGTNRQGKISVRLVNDEIRGAWTTSEKSGINPGNPELADLLWKRGGKKERPDLTPAQPVPEFDYGTKKRPDLSGTPLKPEVKPDLRFSETKELVLSMDSSKFMLDLDTGNTMGPPATIRPEQEQMDVETDQVQPYHYPTKLTSHGLVGLEVKSSDWDASVTEVRRAMTGKAVGPLKEMDLGPEKNPTYFFKTKERTIGVLQLLELVDKPKGIRLRYKTVQAEPEKSPTNTTAAGPKLRHAFPTADGVNTIAYSPDGKLIAIAKPNPDDGGRILYLGGKRLVEILDAGLVAGHSVVPLKLIAAEEDEILAGTTGLPHCEVSALAFSPMENVVAVGTSLGQVKLFNPRTGELLQSLDDETAKLAEKKTSKNLKSLKRAMGSVRSLAFSPGGTLLAMCGGSFEDVPLVFDKIERGGLKVTGPGRLKVWEVKTGTLLHDLVGHSHADAVSFSEDGTLLASSGRWSGADHGTGVIIWNALTGKKVSTLLQEANAGTHAVVFSPTSKLVAIGSRQYDKENDTYTTAVSVAYALSGITEWKRTFPGWANPKAFSPDGKTVVVLCGEQSIRFIKTATGEVQHEIKCADFLPATPRQGAQWFDFAITPTGPRLAIGGVDKERKGSVEIWDVGGSGAATNSAPAKDGENQEGK